MLLVSFLSFNPDNMELVTARNLWCAASYPDQKIWNLFLAVISFKSFDPDDMQHLKDSSMQ